MIGSHYQLPTTLYCHPLELMPGNSLVTLTATLPGAANGSESSYCDTGWHGFSCHNQPTRTLSHGGLLGVRVGEASHPGHSANTVVDMMMMMFEEEYDDDTVTNSVDSNSLNSFVELLQPILLKRLSNGSDGPVGGGADCSPNADFILSPCTAGQHRSCRNISRHGTQTSTIAVAITQATTSG